MDERSWHPESEHLVGEFWVIHLSVEPPSQTKTVAQMESKSADKVTGTMYLQSVVFEVLGVRWGSWGIGV